MSECFLPCTLIWDNRTPGKEDRPVWSLKGPRALPITKNVYLFILWPIYDNLAVNCCSLFYIPVCFNCDEVFLCWQFGTPGFSISLIWTTRSPKITEYLHLTYLSGGSTHTSCPATTLTICIKVILPDYVGDLTLPMEIMPCHIPDLTVGCQEDLSLRNDPSHVW